ncbi:MAG: DUF1049 domain-containing protein [Candidatus Omnitrophota bacterium]|nr:MAG: DUF1049 domain-containing protein [Candidatus Omnitrophota bacterium]
MRFITAIKILISILVIILLAIFFMQNTHPVDIQFPFVRGHRFGLIYLLLIAYLSGALTTFFITIIVNAKMRKKRKLKESEELLEE